MRKWPPQAPPVPPSQSRLLLATARHRLQMQEKGLTLFLLLFFLFNLTRNHAAGKSLSFEFH